MVLYAATNECVRSRTALDGYLAVMVGYRVKVEALVGLSFHFAWTRLREGLY